LVPEQKPLDTAKSKGKADKRQQEALEAASVGIRSKQSRPHDQRSDGWKKSR
jgi:hypothetical protein